MRQFQADSPIDRDAVQSMWQSLLISQENHESKLRLRSTQEGRSFVLGEMMREQDAIFILWPDQPDSQYTRSRGRGNIGFVAVKKYPVQNILQATSWVEVTALYVEYKYRHCGYGKVLLDRVVQWAEENDFEDVVLYVADANDKAISFYQREGFRTMLRFMIRPTFIRGMPDDSATA